MIIRILSLSYLKDVNVVASKAKSVLKLNIFNDILCRRLCWKKKDKFSTMNALKWSVSSGLLAVGVTFIQFYVVMLPESDNAIATVYLGKISLILLAVST